MQKGKVTYDERNVSLWRSDCVMAEEEGLLHAGHDVQASEKALVFNDGHDHNFDRVSA